MELTKTKAKELAKKYFFNSEMANGKLLYSHSKAVSSTARILARDKGLDLNFLEMIAWVHDLGYYVNKENHAEESIKLLKKEGFFVDEKMKDCILNHGSNKNPKTEEGKIIQLADKLSIMNKHILRNLLNEEIKSNTISFTKKMFDKCLIKLDELK